MSDRKVNIPSSNYKTIKNKQMNKYFLVVFILYSVNLFSQQNGQSLIPFSEGSKYGFADAEKKVVIPAKYDFGFPFFPGYELTMVIVDGKPFMINRKGKKVFQGSLDYLKLTDFKNFRNLIPARPEIIDLQKNCQLDTCPSFNISAKLNNGRIFDKLGDLYVVSDLKKVLLIDEKGKRKSDLYDNLRHIPFGDYEYCITEDSTLHKKGLLDKNGKTLLKCTYDEIIYQGKGIFQITDNSASHEFKVVLENNIQNGTVDKNVIKDNGLQIKRKGSKFGVIDSEGKTLISFSYDKLYPISGNKFLFLNGTKKGIVNAKEGYLFVDSISIRNVPVPYFPFTDSLFFFNINNKWNLVDINGKRYEQKYDGIFVDYQKLTKGFAGVTVNGKLGVVNKNGAFSIPPLYDEIVCLSENQSFLTRTNNQWIWSDATGKVIINSIDDFSYMIKDYLFVLKGGKWFFVDGVGKTFMKE